MSQTSDLWLSHLAHSLKASQQAAYLWHVEEDRFEFMGDIQGVLGLASSNLPSRKEEFVRLINPQDVVTRQLALADATARCKSGESNFSIHYKIRKDNGAYAPVCERGVAQFDSATGRTTVHSLISSDKLALEEQAMTLQKRNLKDKISYVFSGSNGRQALQFSLEEYLSEPTRDRSKGFLLTVGIDRLSLINEAYGSQVADEVILKTGARLEKLVGDRALVARISGDVFSLFFHNTSQGEMADIAQNVLNIFYHQPIETEERVVHTVVTIGGIKLDDSMMKASSAISRAEMSLQDAKQQGRGCFVFYSDKMTQRVNSFRDDLTIGDDFLRGFRSGRVKLAFQEIMGAKSGEVSFHECLIRLIDEDGTIHTAGKFIDAVEKMGLTRLVDGFCLRQAIQELRDYPELNLSVNVSNHTLTDAQWLKDVTNQLRDRPDVASRLIVEITESAAMNDISQTIRVVGALSDLGCRIALDDFGAGQTAFTQLKDLKLDIVKIDKSFVRNMDQEENMLFIKTLQSLASGMNLETVAEGAETLTEADILIKGGIDHVQGFAYGLPSIERTWLPVDHADRHSSANSKNPLKERSA